MKSELKCEVCQRPCKGFSKRVGEVVTVLHDSFGGRYLEPIVDSWSFGHLDDTELCIGVVCDSCVQLFHSEIN